MSGRAHGSDIDTLAKEPERPKPGLSMIIPAFDAETSIGELIGSIRAYPPVLDLQIIVSDGGSSDGTREVAETSGAEVVRCRKGRGVQMRDGAKAARHEWLLFLHADSALQNGWADAVAAHISTPAFIDTAGYFRHRFDDRDLRARIVSGWANLRSALFALPYGDQGLLISRKLYDDIGGFAPLLLMEDVDIVRRLGRSRLRQLPVALATSAGRYRQDGYFLRSLKNGFLLSLYFLGVSPERLVELYG